MFGVWCLPFIETLLKVIDTKYAVQLDDCILKYQFLSTRIWSAVNEIDLEYFQFNMPAIEWNTYLYCGAIIDTRIWKPLLFYFEFDQFIDCLNGRRCDVTRIYPQPHSWERNKINQIKVHITSLQSNRLYLLVFLRRVSYWNLMATINNYRTLFIEWLTFFGQECLEKLAWPSVNVFVSFLLDLNSRAEYLLISQPIGISQIPYIFNILLWLIFVVTSFSWRWNVHKSHKQNTPRRSHEIRIYAKVKYNQQ